MSKRIQTSFGSLNPHPRTLSISVTPSLLREWADEMEKWAPEIAIGGSTITHTIAANKEFNICLSIDQDLFDARSGTFRHHDNKKPKKYGL